MAEPRFYIEALERETSLQRKVIIALLLLTLLLLAILAWVVWSLTGQLAAERSSAEIERLTGSSLGDLGVSPEDPCSDCGQTPGVSIGANIPDNMVSSDASPDGGSWAAVGTDGITVSFCWTPDGEVVARANARAAAVTGNLPMVSKEGEWCDAAPSLLEID